MKFLISLLLLISFGCRSKVAVIENENKKINHIDTAYVNPFDEADDQNPQMDFRTKITACDSLLPKGYMILLNSNTKEYIAANNGKYFKSEDTLSVLHGSSMSSWGYVDINNIRDAWRFKDTCELKKYLLYGINKRQKEMDDIDNNIRERKIKDSIANDFKPLK